MVFSNTNSPMLEFYTYFQVYVILFSSICGIIKNLFVTSILMQSFDLFPQNIYTLNTLIITSKMPPNFQVPINTNKTGKKLCLEQDHQRTNVISQY